ncbi:Ras-specific guanine nucleotide-releasing factor RalGPS1 [Lepeophtheirus salmonis]|uniref:Ras-specific guanine nucleotide-releasing factor RalGPS1 n=1 Tax=Lepeophtheirus salmonis TaxID=72036 RepID=A0A7R8GZE6_LEPSM|nr:Ras-specific guanine nucleotide-releasing factor RalGPS1 [Lepeophtheirus salmonis]CAF2752458.1 Ras-specific guanine nucleotide-releasing factor RalGPS1 [Lepeophtheirus salmonis]
MNTTALRHRDCIPYLGLYLTDLVYVDMAHPHSGGIEPPQRQLKMNNILRIVSELQQSSYSHLQCIPFVQQYLKSIRYIDELQKFIEDDHYKLSLKLEPNVSPAASSSSSKESVRTDPNLMAELNLSPAKGSFRNSRPFVPGHRKSRSDGGSIFLACGGSIEDPSPCWLKRNDDFSASNSNLHILTSEKLCLTDVKESNSINGDEDSTLVEAGTKCTLQGIIKRKTLIKEGRRPTMPVWQKYWIQLWGSSLFFYSLKKMSKGLDRRDFRTDPCKYQSIAGWIVMVSADPHDCPASFQLSDPFRKNVYRFRAPNPEIAQSWCKVLHDGSRRNRNDDLISTCESNFLRVVK